MPYPADIPGSQRVFLSDPATGLPYGASNPIPTGDVSDSRFTPAQIYVPIPAFVAGDSATKPLVLATKSDARYREIINNGSADVELWFGSRPTDGDVGQTPRRGLVLPANGGGRIYDNRVPTTAIYATTTASGGLSVIQG